ncbi:MAG: hypothetical protein K2K37_05180 [Muribaculaceae bacterium]|nr:hypothetical protein [Muribaculaceae bacterium]
MIRILAHDILFDGHHYKLSVAQFADDLSSVVIFPFREEIAHTAFVDGCICILKVGDSFVVKKDGRILDIRNLS